LAEHRLRYAAWTCASAIARGTDGAKTRNVFYTLRQAGIETELEKKRFTSHAEYDAWHPGMVKRVIKAATKNGIALTYGQGAKLLAIYIKTLHIVPGIRKDLLTHAHPPIDRILLKNRLPKGQRSNPMALAWTKFDQPRYQKTFAQLEQSSENGKPRWMIEASWHPELMMVDARAKTRIVKLAKSNKP